MIYLSPSSTPVSLIGERYSLSRRNKEIILPSIFHTLTSSFFSPVIISNIPLTEEAIFYNLTLVGLNQIWHSYWIKIETKQCYEKAFEYSLIQFWVPWSKEDELTQIGPFRGQSVEMLIRLNVPKIDPNDTRNPHLYLMLEPNCAFVVKLKLSLSDVLAQLIRHHYDRLLPFIGAILLSALSYQIIPRSNYYPIQFESSQPLETSYSSLISILKNNFWSVSMFGFLPLFSLFLDNCLK